MPNDYVNKVEFGNQTVMDITDTSANEEDVLAGEVFYKGSGARSVGTLSDATQSTHGLMSAADKSKLDNIEDTTALYKTINTPTSIVNFNDGAPYPMGLTAAIDPVQDLHGYDHPWPGGGGKNLLNPELFPQNTRKGITASINGYYAHLSGTSESDGFYISSASSFSLPAGTYTLSVSYTGTITTGSFTTRLLGPTIPQNVNVYESEGSATFTITEATAYAVTFLTGTTITCNCDVKLQIEKSSTATAWEPYSNICPISGFDGANVTVTGKNLAKSTGFVSGVLDWDKSTANTVIASSDYITSDFIPISDGYDKITVSAISGNFVRFYMLDSEKKKLYFRGNHPTQTEGSLTVVMVPGCKYIRFSIGVDGSTFTPSDYGTSLKAQIEYGETATTYEPYAGTTYPITFPTSAGTVYGGTVTMNPDGTGELVVEKACVTYDGSSDETINRSRAAGGKYRFGLTMPSNAIFVRAKNADDESYFGLSDKYKKTSPGGNYLCLDMSFAINHNSDSILVYRDDAQTINEFKNVLSNDPVTFCGELATPITYSLTPGQVLSLLGQNNVWADTGDIKALSYVRNTVPELIRQDTAGQVQTLASTLSTVALSGSYIDLLNKPDLSQYLTTVPVMTGATLSTAGTSGLVPAPATTDVDKFLAGDGTYKSGGLPMVILSYGNSTWNDFINAYNNNVIVYCRASSNSNPASGSQTRMAFMAYVNNGDHPTNVEFQYYRSVSSHTNTQMSDQVYIYKLDKTSGWSVIVREAGIKQIVVGNGLTVSYSNNTVTINLAEE